MTRLTPEQKQAIVQAGEAPVRVTDPDSDASFVLLRADVHERLLAASVGDFDVREGYPAVDRIMAVDDSDDPHHLYQVEMGRSEDT